MRILQVYPSFKSVRGGVERYIEGLTKYLCQKGHTIKVLTLENEYYTFTGERFVQVKASCLSSLSTIFCERFDIVHTHGFRVPFASLIGLLRKLRKDHTVMTVHTIFPKRSFTDGLLKNFYDVTLGITTLKTFDGFIAINNQVQNKLRGLGLNEGRIRLIPNSVDLSRFKELPSPELFLGKIGISSAENVVLAVGRIDWQKGMDQAIRSFAGFQKAENNAKLVIIGKDFGFQDYLLKLTEKLCVNENVIFVGELSDELLYSAYASAKVLLMTSIYEGFPTVLLEAMASGLPVISTPIKGVSEMIPSYGGVVWSERRHLEKRLFEILSDNSLRENLSRRAIETVENAFNWEKNSDSILDFYNSILD